MGNLYAGIISTTWSLLFFFGFYLLLGTVSSKNIFKNYIRSRRILGLGFLVVAIMYFLQGIFNMRDNNLHLSLGLGLSVNYFFSLLLEMSFTSLFDVKFNYKKRIHNTIYKISFFLIMLFGGTFIGFLYDNQKIVLASLILSLLFFIIDIGYIVKRFIKTYIKAVSTMENYSSDNLEHLVRSFKYSIMCIIVVGMPASVVIFTNKTVVTFYSVLLLAAFIYVFCSFVNFAISYVDVENAIISENSDDNCERKANINTLQNTYNKEKKFEMIKEALDNWIAQGGYKTQSITIEQLAIQIGTNRTYLSFYINTTFECTFREWIIRLRLDEAKRILLSSPTIKISKLSEEIGFVSDSHFVRLFSQKEKQSPAKWREENYISNLDR